MNKFGQNTDQPAVYFNKLYMKNVRCFKGNHEIDLGNGNGEPSQWTVILGNNNVGKTTILRVIANFNKTRNYKEVTKQEYENKNLFKNTTDSSKYITIKEEYLFNGLELIKFYKNKWKLHNTVTIDSNLLRNIAINKKNLKFEKEFSDWITKLQVSSFTFTFKINSTLSYEDTRGDGYFKLFGYGTTRIMIDSQSVIGSNTQGLFDNKTLLLNVEEWLKELYFASNNKNKQAEKRYKQVENILCGGLLPEVTELRITTIPDKSSFETFPEFLTSQGWVRLEDLGYGYQATLAWVADLAKRMFDLYPDLENPLHGPAVVLVDEIDLHLHPEWQRKIIKYLSDLFPNTQFIVTAHSPLIIQSAENVNLIMLEKDDNPDGKGINIRQRFGSFQGWTVDEILTELMNLGDRTRSDLYLHLMQDFENAVLDDDYEKAQSAYNHLDTILSPSSYQRKVLQIQMSSLIPVGV
jgi:predicted ATPase